MLVIYTGGTFGMQFSEQGNALSPVNWEAIIEKNPKIAAALNGIKCISAPVIKDSSDIGPQDWVKLRDLILAERSAKYILVIHGTDTMAFTSSALSFMLRGFSKTVIFTGAQIPLGFPQSDAEDNLLGALKMLEEIQVRKHVGHEVLLFFGGKLLRANRTKKVSSKAFEAFHAAAQGGIWEQNAWNAGYQAPRFKGEIKTVSGICEKVLLLQFFPGISVKAIANRILTEKPKGIILETFGMGNIPRSASLMMVLKNCIEKGIPVLNVSQCLDPWVDMNQYENGKMLQNIGVIGGKDLTLEAATTKMMVLLAEEHSYEQLKTLLGNPIAGEMAVE